MYRDHDTEILLIRPASAAGVPFSEARVNLSGQSHHRQHELARNPAGTIVPVRLGPPLSAAAATEPAVSMACRPTITSEISEYGAIRFALI